MDPANQINILCPGQSLRHFIEDPPDPCPLTIGVNRVAGDFPCHFWAFNDSEVFDWAYNSEDRPFWKPPLGNPTIFTSNTAFERIERRDLVDDFKWLFYGMINTSCPGSPGWTNFTVTVALVLAEYLHRQHPEMNHVALYGCDQQGVTDFDGKDPPRGLQSRSEQRWRNELHRFDHVAAWLKGQGVTMERVRPMAGAVQ